MGFKKGDKVVLIDDNELYIPNMELYGIYTVNSYSKTENDKYRIPYQF